MQRLITFGCSYTYGTGLEDCKNWFFNQFHHLKPSKLGWAQTLANKLEMELVNKSFPGSSNMEILYTILKFDFKKDDTVIIMWSHFVRDMLFNNQHKFPLFRDRLGPWNKTHQERKWVEFLDEKDYAMKSWFNIQHADLHLNKLGVRYIHYPATPNELERHKIDFINVSNWHNDGITIYDKATDDMHPGQESNNAVAEKMYRILNVGQ